MIAARGQCREIARHAVIGDVARYHLGEPPALLRDTLVHPPPQLRLDGLQLGASAFAAGSSLELEPAAPIAATDMRQAQEREAPRFAEATSGAILGCKPAEFDQPGLVPIERQPEGFQPLHERCMEPAILILA